MRSTLGLENITKKIESSLESDLNKCGLMYRMFSRVKTEQSITNKVTNKKYRENGKKITDVIGIRITLYFQDDVELVYNLLKNKSNFDHESTDSTSVDEFKPIRCNLTFNFLDEYKRDANLVFHQDADVIDTMYEVQIRTVLSEGWHEVEHDLRYKCKEDWEEHNDLNRNLNGIFATLETSEFSMLQLFNNLSHRHYKNKNIEAVFKTKFRIRLINTPIDEKIAQTLVSKDGLLKKFYRINRNAILTKMMKNKVALPLTLDNFIFILNYLVVKDSDITSFASEFIKNELELYNFDS